jgi:nitrogen regulatory protein P-II 1
VTGAAKPPSALDQLAAPALGTVEPASADLRPWQGRAARLILAAGRVLEEADPMKLITAIVEPDVTDDLVLAVTAAGAHGLTATEVIGLGQAHGQAGAASSAACAALLPGVRVDIVVQDDVVDAVTSAIANCANTGIIGDGKIWVSPVDSVLRTRTGERDNSAV